MEHHPEVPPYVEEDLTQVPGQGMQGKEQNSTTNDGDALHGSVQDVRVLARCSLDKMVSHACIAVREDLDAYEETEMSPRRDRWVRERTGEL